MSSSAVVTSPDTAKEPIAPWWHTLLVLVPLAIGSAASWYQHGLPNVHVPGISSRLSSYITVMVQEWCVVLLIWLALRRRGLSIGSLVSGRWQTLSAFFRDLGLAVGFLVVAVPLVGVLVHLIGGDTNSSVANMTPKTVFELVVWLGLAATGGFCEELVFRGYLTQQFLAWTGGHLFAIAISGWPHRLIRPSCVADGGNRLYLHEKNATMPPIPSCSPWASIPGRRLLRQ
jgi:uncharacterized protein